MSFKSGLVLGAILLCGTGAGVAVWMWSARGPDEPHREVEAQPGNIGALLESGRSRPTLRRFAAPSVRSEAVHPRPGSSPTRQLASTAPAPESVVRELCSYCHQFPEPEIQPKSVWRMTVNRMREAPLFGNNMRRPFDLEAVIAWYEQRAPEELSLQSSGNVNPGGLDFEMRNLSPANREDFPEDAMVANVRFVDLIGDERLELLVSDMLHSVILLGKPYEPSAELIVVARVPHPAHVEVVDLDEDGRRDLLIADLGSMMPEDHRRGTVQWARQTEQGEFVPAILSRGLGRVADVQPCDFDGDGDTDFAVAEFGQTLTGRVLVLENRSESWDKPKFVPHAVDARPGATHVPIVDLDNDGRPDFVTLLAQEHEMVVAFLNRGDFRFERVVISRAAHPEWGSTGIQAVDLDQDGDTDLLLTNGDTLDTGRAHPDHGVEWLENQGDLRFERRRIATLYGAHGAAAADLDGDGDLDIAAATFLHRQQRPDVRFAAVVWLEQVSPGDFVPHVLETATCRHMALAAGDYDLDGDVDIAAGNGSVFEVAPDWVSLWENRANSPVP